uniref:DNA-directed DNA polymerase n=1 Tax=Trichogramma kaykai TaxID=54128 RepID=A0ABD2VTF8_9HYME
MTLANGQRLVVQAAIIDIGETPKHLSKNDTRYDSLNYFHMKLSALPGAFGLPVSSKKGYFSHFFNTLENKEYIGPMPAASFYGLETMSTSKREKFLAWYETAREQIFDIRKEEIEYCRMDVEILRRACLEFRKTMLDLAGVDPFVQATTIASACSYMFRKKYLKENTIALIPPAGYRPRKLKTMPTYIRSGNRHMIISSIRVDSSIIPLLIKNFNYPHDTLEQ